MASQRSLKKTRSLSNLKQLLAARRPSAPAPADERAAPAAPPHPAAQAPEIGEAELFAKAMADVTPLGPDRHWRRPENRPRRRRSAGRADLFELEALQRLIADGDGFRVADTPEYMEAAGPGVDPTLLRKLHQGRYSVQGHLDLHGLTEAEAQEALSHFMYQTLAAGKRMVLVIHGRGLTSPGQPVLKKMVFNWLSRGPLRRHILAFTSARACDGGAGATYVLLRKRPWSKKKRNGSG